MSVPWSARNRHVDQHGRTGGQLLNLSAILVFAGKDASGALAKTSTKAEDVTSEWKHLDDKEKGVLNDWVTFFSKRYNVVGKVEGATNFE